MHQGHEWTEHTEMLKVNLKIMEDGEDESEAEVEDDGRQANRRRPVEYERVIVDADKKIQDLEQKLNEKIQARQQSLITTFIRQRQMATLDAIADTSDAENMDQLLADNTQLIDKDMFDGWEEEEIEANRIGMLARAKETADAQTGSPA